MRAQASGGGRGGGGSRRGVEAAIELTSLNFTFMD